ncbi:hypothetical protein DMN91_006301 [Ooceraea biroi]|uniref:Uncharacterized protein n=1 Tax=Ooceraea biroi TaxID=2015173 RepID=A0A026WPS2_OOCBI|nr:uncharacterized protein LOC105276729 [Ooceraea biroi]EZA58057.1 hypothetical protein X777_01438 [Ooceraea biroi]RLU21922.1 hypothetical protein DMN91_006301 [Ooceraea biroi]
MMLFTLISIISCVAAYPHANEQKSVTSIENESLLLHGFHREANSQIRIAANLADGAPPQLSSNIDDNLRLFDNGRTTVDLGRDIKLAPGSNPQGNAQLDIIRKVGENGFLRVYSDLYLNDGIFRRKRRAASMGPHFRSEAETLGKNNFVGLQRGAGGHGVQSAFDANVGSRFGRELIDEIEEEINHRRRRDKLLSLSDYIRC